MIGQRKLGHPGMGPFLAVIILIIQLTYSEIFQIIFHASNMFMNLINIKYDSSWKRGQPWVMPDCILDQRNSIFGRKLGHLGMGLFLTIYMRINYILNTYLECSGQGWDHLEVIPSFIFTLYQRKQVLFTVHRIRKHLKFHINNTQGRGSWDETWRSNFLHVYKEYLFIIRKMISQVTLPQIRQNLHTFQMKIFLSLPQRCFPLSIYNPGGKYSIATRHKNNITWYIVTRLLIGLRILTEILIEPKVGQAMYLQFIKFLYGFQARVLLSLTRKCSRLHTPAFQNSVGFRVLGRDLSTVIVYPKILCEIVVHRLNVARFQIRIFLKLSQKCFLFLISSHKSFRLLQELWSSMSVCPKILHEVLMLKFDLVRNILLLQDIQSNIIWHIVSKNLIGLGIVTKIMIGPKVGQTKNLQFSQFLGEFRVKTLLSLIWMWLRTFQILEGVLLVLKYINRYILLKHINDISNIIRFSFEKLWSSEIFFINKVIFNSKISQLTADKHSIEINSHIDSGGWLIICIIYTLNNIDNKLRHFSERLWSSRSVFHFWKEQKQHKR